MAFVSQASTNWVTTLSQKLSFTSRMAATAKKIRTLSQVVKKSTQLYQRSTYKNVENEVQTEHGGFRGWVSRLTDVVTRSTQTLMDANQERLATESRLSRFGFIVGGSLERETEHPIERDKLLKKLVEADLYSKTKSTQLDLLPGAIAAAKPTTLNSSHKNLKYTATEVVRLTGMLDELLSDQTRLNHNDAQQAFYLRDSIYGLLKNYTQLKQSGSAVSSELQQYLNTHKDTLERAVGYSRWSSALRDALGI